jgi:hypothetical protein
MGKSCVDETITTSESLGAGAEERAIGLDEIVGNNGAL